MGAIGKIDKEFLCKIKERIHHRVVVGRYGKKGYYKWYPCYYHMLRMEKKGDFSVRSGLNYLTQRPHPDAGIGHQMANWISGYWFAQQLGLQYAHMPFSKSRCGKSVTKWEEYLGFGVGESSCAELIENGYKKIQLPQFDEDDPAAVEMIRRIINSYANDRVVFYCEQNQYFRDQFLLCDELKEKYYHKERKAPLFQRDAVNVAIHIRRGDIVQQQPKNDNLTMRWIDNGYYLNIARQIQRRWQDKQVHFYIFSQGNQQDFADFDEFENIHYCLDISELESFEHMCMADVLVISKSSFSYNPALLCNGIKVCPADFWHGYPKAADWIIADSHGNVNLAGVSL